LGGIYQGISNLLFLFARCYVNVSSSYVGCFILSVTALSPPLYKCIETDEDKLPFLFRPLSIVSTSLLDNTKNYANVSSVISNLPMQSIADSTDEKDFFVRIIGGTGTNCSITSSDFPTIISPFITRDGSLGTIYDGYDGIKLIYSRGGKVWKDSGIFVARDAHSPLYIDENIIAYITDYGIIVKLDHLLATQAAMNIGDLSPTEGNYTSLKESVQQQYDNLETHLVGSGEINSQRLSGYKTAEGVYRIFYYDPEDLLCCAESSDQKIWNMSPNF